MRKTNPRRDVAMLLALVGSIVVAAAFTLNTIVVPQKMVADQQASPHGYTMSLLLFLLPLLLTGYWVIKNSPHQVHVKALLAAGALVFTLGCTLDFLFGYAFFVFPHLDATLGIRLPAWSWSEWAWIPAYLPIEEFAFYSLGALFMLVLYVWADHDWLSDYEPHLFRSEAQQIKRILTFHPWLLVAAAVLIGAGILYKKYGNHPYHEGFPGYFTFQVVLLFLPTAFLYGTVGRFVNWRAFGFTLFILLLVSLIWEASLGLPYGWWGYKPGGMLGLMVYAWANLPVEAVLLWLVAAWGTVLCYEFFRVFFHMERGVRQALLGRPDARDDS